MAWHNSGNWENMSPGADWKQMLHELCWAVDERYRMVIAESATTATSFTSSGSTVTVTTPSAHGITAGDYVSIYGAVETYYNGTFAVATTPTSTTFTYTAAGTPSASPATGKKRYWYTGATDLKFIYNDALAEKHRPAASDFVGMSVLTVDETITQIRSNIEYLLSFSTDASYTIYTITSLLNAAGYGSTWISLAPGQSLFNVNVWYQMKAALELLIYWKVNPILTCIGQSYWGQYGEVLVEYDIPTAWTNCLADTPTEYAITSDVANRSINMAGNGYVLSFPSNKSTASISDDLGQYIDLSSYKGAERKTTFNGTVSNNFDSASVAVQNANGFSYSISAGASLDDISATVSPSTMTINSVHSLLWSFTSPPSGPPAHTPADSLNVVFIPQSIQFWFTATVANGALTYG